MGDPKFEELASSRYVPARRPRLPRLLILAFAAFLALYALGFRCYSRTPFTCAVCRKEKVEKTCLGLHWSDQEETDCTRWYRNNVEPTHAHFWIQGTVCRRFGIPGLYGGYACSIGGPLTGLSRSVQVDIYKHFANKSDAKQLFIELGTTEFGIDGKWSALMEWVNADYPGTWGDWWEKHREPQALQVDGHAGPQAFRQP
jgi:hypothetical protein